MAILTIDDVPSRLFLEKLRWLGAEGIHAVLFVWGELAVGHEDWLLEALRAGHSLGNHAWSHRGFSGLSSEEAFSEIDRTHNLLATLYDRAGIPWTRKFFRFPYLDQGRDTEQRGDLQGLLAEFGYAPLAPRIGGCIDAGCDFDQKEYLLGKSDAPNGLDRAEAILARIGPGTPSDRDVILIHDHDYSHELFFECIRRYRALGVRFGKDTIPWTI